MKIFQHALKRANCIMNFTYSCLSFNSHCCFANLVLYIAAPPFFAL